MILTANPVVASVDSVTEITTLLDRVATSSCTFERNGKRYTGDRARAHLERKRHYLGKRIGSAEDFIRTAATGSSRSGEPYWIVCDGERTRSADWLTQRLEELRREYAGTLP
jgi:hypothetical protein